MADINKNEAVTASNDALHAGFKDAMDRVNSVAKGPTLVDLFTQEEWASFDACEENPLVADSDGEDVYSDDDEVDLIAA
jgi:hypothetical protein